MAHNALLYHNEIDHKYTVDFIGEKVEWDIIAGRLQKAVINKDLIFNKTELIKNKNKTLVKKGEVKRKGKKRGL